MKNKVLTIILIVGLLLSSTWTVITRVNLKELQESILIVSQRLEQREATLASTTDMLIKTQADLRNNQVALTNVETKLLDTERKLSITDMQLDLTEVELRTNQGKLDSMTMELELTKVDLRTNQGKLDSMTMELELTKVDLRTNQGKLDSTARELSATKGELTTLGQTIKLIGNLEERIKSFNSELKVLEARRLVLIPKTKDVIFLCTGSMDPKITCMDTAEYLTNFKPEDVIRGTIISFISTCDLSGDRISHRVIDIKIEGGEYFYRTKGDNNSEDDGCWIPSKAVAGYMISLTKGSDSVMEGLLSYVWSLETKAKSLKVNLATLDKSITYYDGEYNRLLSMYSAYCPYVNIICILPSGSYQIARSLYQQLESLRLNYNRMLDDRNSMVATYNSIKRDITDKRNELESLRCSRLKLCI